jgi:hypothetical protein
MTMQEIRRLMFFETGAFAAAALSHLGVLIKGYEHLKAATAESVIALVLLASLAATWLQPRSARTYGLAAQALALVGTLVGIFTIAIGIGPQTVPDVAYHIGITAVLAFGVVASLGAGHSRDTPTRRQAGRVVARASDRFRARARLRVVTAAAVAGATYSE